MKLGLLSLARQRLRGGRFERKDAFELKDCVEARKNACKPDLNTFRLDTRRFPIISLARFWNSFQLGQNI